ncbi:hypothetical protein IHE44_0004116 [Lamprotornis superbus]|uniref:Uncharacterized protein n=1 Tax=Lamprotornis superbus TaxID=245042 RepID=A0A835NKX6_9PASS|nr:hypothetical protein IHE44_0004116 [Lamprotornis superbus]
MGSQMGAQNTSSQPSLRLSPCCLLLPGRCDPGAELCEEPLELAKSASLARVELKDLGFSYLVENVCLWCHASN